MRVAVKIIKTAVSRPSPGPVFTVPISGRGIITAGLQERPFFSALKNSAAAALLFGLVFQSAVLPMLKTLAYFNDTQISAANTFSAGTLGIALSPPNKYVSGVLYQGDATTTLLTVSNAGSLNFNYTAKISPADTGPGPCDYVNLTAVVGTSTYSSLLKDFVSATSTLATSTNIVWSFNFSIASSAPPSVWNRTCDFKWRVSAWQDNFSGSSSGFSNIREKFGSIQLGASVVLNEFLANPSGDPDAPMPGGQWVELYNNSIGDIDVNGWYIYNLFDRGLQISAANSDNNHNVLDSGETIVPAHGWLVVYRNGDGTFSLNKFADAVRLYSGILNSGVLVDAVVYNGNGSEIPVNKSIARIPDGIGPWVDPVPTPCGPNKLTEDTANMPEQNPPPNTTLADQSQNQANTFPASKAPDAVSPPQGQTPALDPSLPAADPALENNPASLPAEVFPPPDSKPTQTTNQLDAVTPPAAEPASPAETGGADAP